MIAALQLSMSCVEGEPESPRTWSGTPAHLITALREAGVVVHGFHNPLRSAAQQMLGRADRLLGYSHHYLPGRLRRMGLAANATTRAKQSGAAACLHLTTYDMPLCDAGRALPRYLFADTTYVLWRDQAFTARRLSARLHKDFLELERRQLRSARSIFAIGRHVAESLVRDMGVAADRVQVVGSGLGQPVSVETQRGFTRPLLLTVAKVRHEDKGIPLLLEAFQHIRASIPDAELVLIGGARWCGEEPAPGVRATGWLETEVLQHYFAEASLFVMPAFYEPWGLAYLEALAQGLPIVGLDRNAFPELSGDGRFGIACAEETPAALATLIVGALRQPEKLRQMGLEGKAHVLKHFHWSRVAQAMKETVSQHQELQP